MKPTWSWKNVFTGFLFTAWSAFTAFWPNILANLISDIFSFFLKTPLGQGWEIVLLLSIVSFMIFWKIRSYSIKGKYGVVPPQQVGTAEKHLLMQGGMFSLANILSNICYSYCPDPSFDKAVSMIWMLIPALEGAIGAEFVMHTSHKYAYKLKIASKNSENEASTKRRQERIEAEKYLSSGYTLFTQNQYKEAIQYFSEYIQRISDNPTAYYLRGSSYLHMNRYGLAIRDFDQAIRLDPKSAQAYYHRAQAYLGFRNVQQAIADLQICLRFADQDLSNEAEALLEHLIHG